MQPCFSSMWKQLGIDNGIYYFQVNNSNQLKHIFSVHKLNWNNNLTILNTGICFGCNSTSPTFSIFLLTCLAVKTSSEWKEQLWIFFIRRKRRKGDIAYQSTNHFLPFWLNPDHTVHSSFLMDFPAFTFTSKNKLRLTGLFEDSLNVFRPIQ